MSFLDPSYQHLPANIIDRIRLVMSRERLLADSRTAIIIDKNSDFVSWTLVSNPSKVALKLEIVLPGRKHALEIVILI